MDVDAGKAVGGLDRFYRGAVTLGEAPEGITLGHDVRHGVARGSADASPRGGRGREWRKGRWSRSETAQRGNGIGCRGGIVDPRERIVSRVRGVGAVFAGRNSEVVRPPTPESLSAGRLLSFLLLLVLGVFRIEV